ncbi:hypothetical protein BKA66DRAFT_470968 [Pyrenochaeta sp. MPI-SDFR-AT-0127]|nr:hypothetical protein BKA66DRAFT_470968 [Pyrenochaeta sp. MPI-SDFR-AT-0127]
MSKNGHGLCMSIACIPTCCLSISSIVGKAAMCTSQPALPNVVDDFQHPGVCVAILSQMNCSTIRPEPTPKFPKVP